MLMFQLLIATVFGIVAAIIASNKGRNVMGWFFGGFFLGLVGVVIVAVLSNKKAEAARHAQQERERRRLREQLRQEQLKNESFRRYADDRLDTHDNVLGVDTRSRPALPTDPVSGRALPASKFGPQLESDADGDGDQQSNPYLSELIQQQQAPPARTSRAGPPPLAQPEAVWWYENAGQTKGPATADEIQMLLADKILTGHNLIWTDGMADWQPIKAVSHFRSRVAE